MAIGGSGEALQPKAENSTPTPAVPRCPQCGWSDVRLSKSKGALDAAMLGALSLAPFRCRTCGRRFYRFHRGAAAG